MRSVRDTAVNANRLALDGSERASAFSGSRKVACKNISKRSWVILALLSPLDAEWMLADYGYAAYCAVMFGSKKKNAAFFGAFSDHAATSVDAAKLLVELFSRIQVAEGQDAPYRGANAGTSAEVDEGTRALAVRIKQAETAGDTITHQTMKHLRETWITPLDRNDIHGLISRMDDVLDFVEAAAERTVLFQICEAPREAAELSNKIVLACESLAKAVALLPTMARAKEMLAICVEVNRLENEADAIYRRGIAGLFKPGNDPLTVMKWRDIFDSLESAMDRCEDVANIIEGVVLEYA